MNVDRGEAKFNIHPFALVIAEYFTLYYKNTINHTSTC